MDEVYSFLMNEVGVNNGDTLIIGVSGGPDSMALLHFITTLKKKIDVCIVCAHVNHNVRLESADEEIFVKDFCKAHHVIFESMKIDSYGDDNFHNEARSKRYRYFESLIQRYHAKYLLTAHHGDDLIETILMRIVRGSTLRGYSGFSRIVERDDYTILRPFIHLTKEDIYYYLEKNHVPYVQDLSNEKDVYTRNRFRKYIVPELKKEDINVHTKFYKFSNTLLQYNNYIDKVSKEQLNQVFHENKINIEKYLELDSFIGMKIIYSILESIYQDDLMLITDHHAELVDQLIRSSKSNAELYLPNNIHVIKSYHTIQFGVNLKEPEDYNIEIIDDTNLPTGKNIEIVNSIDSDNNFVCRLSKEDIVLPLYVRNRRNGDTMLVKGLNGHKKIKDIFIDEKIEKQKRNQWPVVVDSRGLIVWLPGLKKSQFDKTKDEKYDIILKYN